MWLIKLHIAFSVLCLVTFLGFRTVFRDAIKQNGWIPETKGAKKRNKLSAYLMLFCPIMNMLCVLMVLIEATVTKVDDEEWAANVGKKEEK